MLRSKNDIKKNHPKSEEQNSHSKERKQKKEISQTNNEIIWWINGTRETRKIVCNYL